MLCWDLKALPTHHLPWAGFGLRQPHWLILKCDVENSRIHCDLEKIDPILHPVINSSWQSYLSFKKSRQQLNHSEIQRYLDSKSKMDFEKSKDEKDLIEKKMLEIDKLMVKRIRSFLVEEDAA